MINRVILIGNLGQNPDFRNLESGATVAKFSVATNENYKDKSGEWQTQTEWHDVICWRHLAEKARDTLSKGAMVYVEGKLTHRTWQDKDGNNRKTTEVVASYFRAISKSEETKEVRKTPVSPEIVAAVTSGEPSGDDDDLPF